MLTGLQQTHYCLFVMLAKASIHMWTAPCLQEETEGRDQLLAVHMSGLLVRSVVTAGPDGFRGSSP
jgi:hypothetical protein